MSSSENQTSSSMLQAPVSRTLLLMSAPISLGMLSTFLFQVLDTYFVGKLGAMPLAALGFAATVYFLLVGLFMGMAVGVSSLVGGALGQGDEHLARRYTTLSIVISIVLSVALSGLGLVTVEPLFSLLGAKSKLIPLIREYMEVLYYGLPFLIFGFFGLVGVFVALSLSNLLSAIVASRLMKRYFVRVGSGLSEARPVDDYLADWRYISQRIRGIHSSPTAKQKTTSE